MMQTQHPTTLGDLRREAGLTQQTLAIRAGLALSTVQKAEVKDTDILRMQVGTALSLAKALGMTLDDFVAHLA